MRICGFWRNIALSRRIVIGSAQHKPPPHRTTRSVGPELPWQAQSDMHVIVLPDHTRSVETPHFVEEPAAVQGEGPDERGSFNRGGVGIWCREGRRVAARLWSLARAESAPRPAIRIRVQRRSGVLALS